MGGKLNLLYIKLYTPRLLKSFYKLFYAIKLIKLTYISTTYNFTYISTLLSHLIAITSLLYYYYNAII